MPTPGFVPGSQQPVPPADDVPRGDRAARCPSCGALAGAGAQWCGLCFADLRPGPPPEPTEAPTEAPAEPAAEPTAGTAAGTAAEPAAGTATPLHRPDRVTWPCGGCGASVDVALDACPVCGLAFLGALRSTGDGVRFPVVGDVGRLSERGRIVLGASVGLILGFALVILTALLG